MMELLAEAVKVLAFVLTAFALVVAGYFSEQQYLARYPYLKVAPYGLITLVFLVSIFLGVGDAWLLFVFLIVLAAALQVICIGADRRRRLDKSKDE